MLLPKILTSTEWHEKLAAIHLAEPDLEQSAILKTQAEKLEKDAEAYLKSKKASIRLKAAEMLNNAKRLSFLSLHIASPVNAKSHVTHFLAAAMTRAISEGKSATLAEYAALQKLLSVNNSEITKAVLDHPSAKRYGFKENAVVNG